MKRHRDKENYLRWKRKWYLKNREKEIARKKKYSLSKDGKQSAIKAVKKYRAKFPEKQRARWLLQKAVERGVIKKLPCEVCGNKKTDGHHNNYSKPLVIMWVCRKCHGSIHRGTKAIKDGMYKW